MITNSNPLVIPPPTTFSILAMQMSEQPITIALPTPEPGFWGMKGQFPWSKRESVTELGTAAHYSPSYLPATTCLGNDPRQFPANNLFATAGDGIWDSGACCGRQYLVRCISSITPGGAACSVKNQTILITIVDHAPDATMSTTMVLSEHAFRVIANAQADSIKIQYQQYSPNTVPNAVLTTSPVKVSGGRGISRKRLIQADASISAPCSGY